MLDERMDAALALLGAGAAYDDTAGSRSAALAASALGVDGICAGVGVGAQGAVLAWGRETVAVTVEGLEFTLGQGPSRDAVLACVPVLVPDIDAPDQAARWPAFASCVAGFPIRAVFAFPLNIGAIGVGVLTAYRAQPGPLTDGQFGDALTLADAVTLLLVHQAFGEPDSVPAAGPERGPGWERPSTYRDQVHQATGMISMQMQVSLTEALVRLRAHAYTEDRFIGEVAADVLARRLHFTPGDA